jgi:hypothetical protein
MWGVSSFFVLFFSPFTPLNLQVLSKVRQRGSGSTESDGGRVFFLRFFLFSLHALKVATNFQTRVVDGTAKLCSQLPQNTCTCFNLFLPILTTDHFHPMAAMDPLSRLTRFARIESAEVSADVLVAALRQAFDNPQFGQQLDIMSQVFCARQPASAATIISVLDQLLALCDDFNAPPVTATATIGLILPLQGERNRKKSEVHKEKGSRVARVTGFRTVSAVRPDGQIIALFDQMV